MSLVIDRRVDGRNKSAVNRRRFIRRYRAQLKQAVADAMERRSITDMDHGENVRIPSKDIAEPNFQHGKGGSRETVYSGNKEFVTGDRIRRPPDGQGGSGDKASNEGEGEDEFTFELSRDEFLDLMFEDLELPDLLKKELARDPDYKMVRAGYTTSGVPTSINIVRSMQQSIARRVALTSGRRRKLEDKEAELAALLETTADTDPAALALAEEVERLRARLGTVPFIDTFDLRFNNRIKEPRPSAQAVMFCLMDVSGSMNQERKDLAKRFFNLLYLFLKRNYQRIDVVFIRHHTVAREVDEQEFFYARETGGTVVSSALKTAHEIIKERYPSGSWNIYVAQASDGDNWPDDSPLCREILMRDLMPLLQYFAYVEITPDRHQGLWHEYCRVQEQFGHFALKQIDSAADIFPVFRELFRRRDA